MVGPPRGKRARPMNPVPAEDHPLRAQLLTEPAFAILRRFGAIGDPSEPFARGPRQSGLKRAWLVH